MIHTLISVCLGEGNLSKDPPLRLRLSVVSNFSRRFPVDLRPQICKSVLMRRLNGETGRIFPNEGRLRRKREIVLRLLRGEPIAALFRELGAVQH